MSSILQGCGSKSIYSPLSSLPPAEIKKYKNIVLVVIDGMGYDQVASLPHDSFLKKNLQGKLNSVFPPTTTAAVTTFLTGAAPQNHGLVAWYLKMKEFGNKVTIILRYVDKEERKQLPQKDLTLPSSVFEKLSRRSTLVFPQLFLKSHYNTLLGKNAEKHTYRAIKLTEFVQATARAATSSSQPRYIYSYWSKYDDFCHNYGKESDKAKKHLAEIDAALQRLAEKIEGTNTLLLVTADHGHTSISKKNTIIFEKYPEFQSYLTASPCGEARAAMLYIHPEKRKEFEQFVHKHWKKCCTMHQASELIEKNYFGLFKPHRALKERVGDYILLAKEGYAFREHKITKKNPFQIGNHGGLSKEELEVPLVMVNI